MEDADAGREVGAPGKGPTRRCPWSIGEGTEELIEQVRQEEAFDVEIPDDAASWTVQKVADIVAGLMEKRKR
jgi:hypothetical protein